MTGIVQTLIGGFGAVAAAVTDAYFNLVTLLLPGNGTNGAQNNTFLDSSTNNFTITRNGNTTQGTFSPFSQTGWGNYFDGSSSISYAANADFNFGTGTFTIEGWVYLTSDATSFLYGTGGSGQGDQFIYDSSAKQFAYYNGTSWTYSPTVSINQWVHFAAVRSGTTITVYANGSGGTGVTSSASLGSTTSAPYTGKRSDGSYNLTGYISNLRVIKGQALYTGTFTPSTSPLTTSSVGSTGSGAASSITGTVSLLTCQSNRFVDNSTTPKTVSVATGSPSVQAFSPFAPTAAYSAATNGGSGYFDGSGDYLTAGAVTDWVFLNRFNVDFTISFWLFHPSASTPYGIISTGWNTTEVGFNIVVNNSGNNIITTFFNRGVSGSAASFDSSANLVPNAWNYVTITYTTSSKTVAFYINGAASGSGSNTGFAYSSSNPAFTLNVGRSIGGTAGSINNLNGYLSGLRILNGSIGSTTLPTEPPTNITNTSILLNFTNAGITDATAKNDLETVGNAQISTTQSKFGGSSMYFDGTGDYLQSSDTNLCVLGSSDWTIEFWLNPTANNATAGLVVKESASANGYNIYLSSSGKLSVALSSNGTSYDINVNGSTTLNTGTWYYCAIVRSGSGTNNVKVYVNGSQDAQATFSSSINNAGSLRIGSRDGASQYFYGYMDDLRITKGYARTVTSSPTAAFPLS